MPDMTCAAVGDLAKRFQPIMRYHKDERLFPVLAEAWLTHCSPEAWGGAGAKLRGTALMFAGTSDQAFAQEEFVKASCAGAGIPAREAILNERGNADNQIGNPLFARPAAGEEVFLDFGGWDDPVAFSMCSPTYLAEIFSGLGAAINPRVTEIPFNKLTSTTAVPTFGVAQPNQPTMYAEVEWAGLYPRIDKKRPGAEKDFAHPADGVYAGLDNYVAVTYYFLYPAAGLPPAGTDGVRQFEAQWEAITVLLKGDRSGGVGDRRPTGFAGLQPRFVVYSQGFDRTDGPNPPAECRPWDDRTRAIQKDGEHPVAYVTAGSHRNFFELRQGPVAPPGPGSGNTHIVAIGIGTPNYNDDVGMAGMIIFIVGALLIAASVLLGPIAFVLGIILLIVGIIVALLGLVVPDDHPVVPEDAPKVDPIPPGQENAATSHDGPSVVPQGGAPAGTPMDASRGTEFVLRVIDRFFEDVEGGIPVPGATACELPPWWGFGGRWGVKLGGANTPRFDSGSRRSDRYERSRGYWNAREAVRFTQANSSFPL